MGGNALRVCSVCKGVKSLSEYSKDPKGEGGVRSMCKLCDQAAAFKRRYNISMEQREELYQYQQGKCALCEVEVSFRSSNTACVDHCHDKKLVRGILCTNCNHALGKFKDDPGVIRRAAEYLEGDNPWAHMHAENYPLIQEMYRKDLT